MKAKSKLLLVALAAILVTVLTQPTLAFYTVAGRTHNVVTSGGVELKIFEKTATGGDFPEEGVYVIPGDIVSKRVSIKNVCEHPFYLRVELISSATSERLDAEDCLKMDINTTHWTLVDGYYYYNVIVEPGVETVPIFTEVEIVGDKVDQTHVGSTLNLTVAAYAVQSENNSADHPWEAAGWPAEEGGGE